MKVLIRLLKNDFTRIFRINQMRYGNPSQRSKAISLYILIFAVVIGIIIYWMNSLHTVFSYAWTIEEVRSPDYEYSHERRIGKAA